MIKRNPSFIHRGNRPRTKKSLNSSKVAVLDKSLPSIFKSDSLWNKFKEEIKVYHRWLGIVFYYSPEFPRSMRVLSLFSSIVIMLFIQSVTYNLADPDDGSCEVCEEQTCCLSMRSTLNSNEDRCYWEISSTNATRDDGSCHFREIGDDLTRIFTVAMISAIVSAPLTLIVQYLITNILSVPCSCDASSADVLVPRKRSKKSQVLNETPELREVSGESLSSDFKNLLDDLSKYCELLQGSPKSSPDGFLDQLKSAWGMLSDLKVPHQSPIASRFLYLFAAQDVSQSTAQHNLLKELSLVRKEVYREYQWFKDGAERVFIDKGACEEAKRRRLLYLFLKDLSSGMSGEVLSTKSQRDSMSSSSSSRSRNVEGISWKWKALAWIFVFFLNMGLLFYVFLFAMTQTHSRQSAWFKSFVMWFVFDVFVSSTGVVLVTHILIPLYVMSDIRTIKKKVLEDINAFREKQRERHKQNQMKSGNGLGAGDFHENEAPETLEFNSARYLFTSWRVASLFPELPESGLILQFSTPWPKRSFKREKKKVTTAYAKKYSFIMQSLSRVVIFFISGLIHLPMAVQDLVIQVASSSGLGYVVLLMVRLYQINPLLPLAPIVALGIVIHFLVMSQEKSELLEPRSRPLKKFSDPFLAATPSPAPIPQQVSENHHDIPEREPEIEWEEEDEDDDFREVWGYGQQQVALLHQKSQNASMSSEEVAAWDVKEDDESSFEKSYREVSDAVADFWGLSSEDRGSVS